ncbi:lysoplasmalogenase [Rhodobacteraceae bacterium RKSG542]|uniref:lysoplasmalogenase n=1 Tax=Pseudovibrio flavus TaxID=2529854 RepID=UPI0012BB4C95|nr:lysoplasmalogenase [Pseudovibrio flavus]MTI15993.1 lysoplasmalogenase [Pseudovibrio flavus]
MISSTLFFTSITAASLYGLFYSWREATNFKTLFKTLALGVIIGVCLIKEAPLVLTAAVAFSALGDYALARDGDKRFLVGLCAFALAHVLYIVLFWQSIGIVDPARIAPAGALMAILALSTRWWLLPYAGELKAPVAIYVLLISIMGALATQIGGVVLMGAFAFIISDILLSLELFRLPKDNPFKKAISVALWFFYYGGQMSIVFAYLAP